jgi:hypothetical protein
MALAVNLADPADGEQRLAGLLVGRRTQPRLVEPGHAGQHLGQPGGPLPVAGEPKQALGTEFGELEQAGERHVGLALEPHARAELGGDARLAGGGEPLGGALGECEVGGALGQRAEPHLVQPVHQRHQRRHRWIVGRELRGPAPCRRRG